MPAFFLGLAAPADLSARIVAWHAGFGHHITAPHLTVKAPGGLDGGLGWWPAVQAACAGGPAVEVRLVGVRTFGARVIYLAVDSAGLRALHLALLDVLGTAPGAQEGAGHTPHLSLALGWRPLSAPWAEVLASARAEFGDLEPRRHTFTARELTLYRKDRPGGVYQAVKATPFQDAGLHQEGRR